MKINCEIFEKNNEKELILAISWGSFQTFPVRGLFLEWLRAWKSSFSCIFDIFETFFCFHWIQNEKRSPMSTKMTNFDVKIPKWKRFQAKNQKSSINWNFDVRFTFFFQKCFIEMCSNKFSRKVKKNEKLLLGWEQSFETGLRFRIFLSGKIW